MQRNQVITTIQSHKEELAGRFGVRSLALFGSIARDDASADSDIDVLVEFSRPTGYFGLVELELFLADLLHAPVDLGTLHSLKPRIRSRVEKDIVHVL